MDQILKDGEAFLEDMELSEANVEQAYNEYREQVYIVDVCGGHTYLYKTFVFFCLVPFATG